MCLSNHQDGFASCCGALGIFCCVWELSLWHYLNSWVEQTGYTTHCPWPAHVFMMLSGGHISDLQVVLIMNSTQEKNLDAREDLYFSPKYVLEIAVPRSLLVTCTNWTWRSIIWSWLRKSTLLNIQQNWGLYSDMKLLNSIKLVPQIISGCSE